MNVQRYLTDYERHTSKQALQELSSRLVLYKVKNSKPGFIVACKDKSNDPYWVVMFDDGPEFWLGTFSNQNKAIQFCNKYELIISHIDKDYIQ